MKKILLLGLLVLMTSCNLRQSAPQIESAPAASATLPATATFTPAPTLTSTPTFTPTPVPMFFTEEFNSDLSAWTFFQTGGEQPVTAALSNDTLGFQMTSPDTWYYGIHNAHEYQSVYISAKVSGSPSGSLGLVCNYSDKNGWFEFNITHEGKFNVLYGHLLATGIAEYKPILNAASEYLQPGNMNYEIGMTCKDNFIFLQVNGKMFYKMDVEYIGLAPGGKVGITAAAFDNVPMNATIDWFKVSEPEW